jgi:alpha-beta hydrolase superfamily lysophospholipase
MGALFFKSRTWKISRVILIAYILIGIALYFAQTLFLFHPKKLAADYKFSFSMPFREVDVNVTDEKNVSIVQFTLPDSLRKGIVLYFHGNRGNINRYARFAPAFTRQGWEVWMIDYPGYGKSRGARTETALHEDALLLYQMAHARVSADSIILYGKSLGTGIASKLAMVRGCRRLILETPYASMASMARHYLPIYPSSPFLKFDLATIDYLEWVKAPVCIFHGTRDRVVPYSQSKKIKRAHEKVELITVPKGRHNNLSEYPLYRQKLDSLLLL